MKRLIPLLLACLLLCGCSNNAIEVCPPDDSRMYTSTTYFQESGITYQITTTVDSNDDTKFYEYGVWKNVEWLVSVQKEQDVLNAMTYQQYRTMLPNLMQRVIEEQFGTVNRASQYEYRLSYSPAYAGMNEDVVRSQSNSYAPSLDKGYYLYHIERQWLEKGFGAVGQDKWGILMLKNMYDGSYAYILITE